jgi:hypothetical protein
VPEPLVGFVLLSWAAFAQEPEPAASPPAAAEDAEQAALAEPESPDMPVAPDMEVEVDGGVDGEVVVFGDLQVAARRAELDQGLRQQGYRMGVRKDGKTIYRPEDAWKPTVVVFDDGFMRLKRSPVRFEPPGQRSNSNKLRYLWCLPPFTPMCLRVGGQVVSKRKLDPQKARVLSATHPQVGAWREALVGRAMTAKVGTELPDRLDQLWATGRPLEGEGPPLADPADRRAAILAHWSNRTCTPEGDAVADVLALFLEYEVQGSVTPMSAAEQGAANAVQRCARRLDLVGSPSP